MKTVTELIDERAQQLNAADDIVRTIKEGSRAWTDADREAHDSHIAAADALEADIARTKVDEADAIRSGAVDTRAHYSVPMINVNGNKAVGSDVTRNLDDLYWSTNETVVAPNGARNQVEQIVVRNAANKGTAPAPRMSAFRPDDREIVRTFQNTVADMALFGLLVDRQAKTTSQGFEVARAHPAFKEKYAHVLRAMDIDTAAEGGNWVPTGIGASVHEKVRAAGKVSALFSRVDMPTSPWTWPLEGTDATAFRVAEPLTDTEAKMTASTPGTNKITFDAEILGARALTSKFLEADSAVAILPYVRQKLIQAFVDGEEKGVLDGDSDGTHQDSDVGASTTDIRTAFDGLRKKALAETTQAITTTTSSNINLLRKSMGKWGVNPSDLAIIVGVSSYLVLMSDTNLITVDKAGPQATILNGQVGFLFGIPVIVSEWVRENLNASGVFDNITTTKTYALVVNRGEWAFGTRMALDVEIDDSIYRETAQRVMVAFMREDFNCITSATTDDATSIGFNITSGS